MLAFDWSKYLDLARSLQGQHDVLLREAALRSAVSRAYYAAFCHARNYARDRQGFIPTGTSKDHRLVRQHFQGRKEFDIADKLDELRQWRNDCDYADLVAGLSQLPQHAVAGAQALLGKLL